METFERVTRNTVEIITEDELRASPFPTNKESICRVRTER